MKKHQKGKSKQDLASIKKCIESKQLEYDRLKEKPANIESKFHKLLETPQIATLTPKGDFKHLSNLRDENLRLNSEVAQLADINKDLNLRISDLCVELGEI